MEDVFDFEKKVLQQSKTKPVLVEFSAPSCGPCIWMEKTLIEVVRQMDYAVNFVSLPVEQNLAIAKRYNISANPTTLLFIDGQVVGQLKGALPASVIIQWINDYL